MLDMGAQIVADELALFGGGADIDSNVILLVIAVENVGDLGLHARRGDAVLGIIGLLLLAPPVGLGDGALHGAGLVVGIEDHLAVDIARRAADGLDERGFRAQEALLVGVENGDETAFGNVETLAQQVDADEAVEGAEAQIADDLDALQRVDIRMHVAHADALFVEIFGEVFRHALGQHGAENAVALVHRLADLAEKIVDLGAGGADLDGRIGEAGRADDLFGEDAARFLQLP